MQPSARCVTLLRGVILVTLLALAACRPAARPAPAGPAPAATPPLAPTAAGQPALPATLAPSATPPPASVLSAQVIDDFTSAVAGELAYYHIPGGAMALVRDGRAVRLQGFGVRDVATGAPFTPETQFRAGSTGKSMTSLMIAQLVDQGALRWDTPVAEIWPSFKTGDAGLTAALTVADLLGMGTGLASDQRGALAWGKWTVDDLFGAIAEQPVQGPFRQYYYYNNELYATAGYMALAAADVPPTLANYAAWMHDHVVDPIGMPSAVLGDDPALLSANTSRSYEATLLGVATPSPMPDAPINVVGPTGGWWLNMRDLARYLATQMSGGVTPEGHRVVSAANLAATWQPGVAIPGLEFRALDNPRYAMGWVVARYRGVPLRFHAGAWKGYMTILAVLPEDGVGLALTTNHVLGSGANYTLMLRLAELLHGLRPEAVAAVHSQFEADLRQRTARAARLQPYAIDAAAVAPLLGVYAGGWRVELRDGKTLWLARPGWEYLLYPTGTSARAYIVANQEAMGAPVDFQERDGGVQFNFPALGLHAVTRVATGGGQ